MFLLARNANNVTTILIKTVKPLPTDWSSTSIADFAKSIPLTKKLSKEIR